MGLLCSLLGAFLVWREKGASFPFSKREIHLHPAHGGRDRHGNHGAGRQTCQGASRSLPVQGRFVSSFDRPVRKGNKLAASLKNPFQSSSSRQGQSGGLQELHRPRTRTLRCALLQAGIKLPSTCTSPASAFFGSLGELGGGKAPLPGSPPDPWQLR